MHRVQRTPSLTTHRRTDLRSTLSQQTIACTNRYAHLTYTMRPANPADLPTVSALCLASADTTIPENGSPTDRATVGPNSRPRCASARLGRMGA